MATKLKPATHDEYLAALTADQRNSLEGIRSAIQAAAPDAVECISYQIPGYRYNGKLLVFYGAAAKHCALYAVTSTVISSLQDDLAAYETGGKGTLRFAPDKPMPAALVRKIVQAMIAERPSSQLVP